jgi:hypothetical protein
MMQFVLDGNVQLPMLLGCQARAHSFPMPGRANPGQMMIAQSCRFRGGGAP